MKVRRTYRILCYQSGYQTGLTLIELLISLVIISIVVTLCANGFTFASRVWAKVDDHQTT